MYFSQLALLLGVCSLSSAAAVSRERALDTRDSGTRWLFTFGDSYTTTQYNVNSTHPSCTGNLIGNPSFAGDTSSGGINWVGEVVSTAPSCTLNSNFAFFGATVNYSVVGTISSQIPSFVDQVSDFTYTAGKKPSWSPWTSSDTAFAVWFGVNDVANSYQNENYPTIDDQDMADYFEQLTNLYNLGGRNFVLLNTPPVQRAPSNLGTSADNKKALRNAIGRWNNRLANQAAIWQKSNSKAQVEIIDTHQIFAQILNHPKQYGAQNASCYDSDGTTCLWWNNYHPGIAIQKAVGKAVAATLKKQSFWS